MLRELLSIATVLAASSGMAYAASEQTFLSWYDGWGTHRVWGVGSLTSGYENASVKCGGAQINVKPIYDTHTAALPPDKKQSADFAKAHNIALMREFSQKGVTCAFSSETKEK